jgi:hypothetical protein
MAYRPFLFHCYSRPTTRLKLLKRQGYGRAGSALLRQRVWQSA